MNSAINTQTSRLYDNEERMKLAENLDRELEDYVANLEKRSTSEAWPENKWQEEIEKHPFFMTKIPENGELPPLLQGLQDLKYSTEENTPEDLAKAYKDDGNYHFKLKKYRMAILCYAEGIKQHCSDQELNGQLYNNRASAHYYLANYRSCYNDCKCALRYVPLYLKAISRLAHTCFKLGLYEECINNCKAFCANERDNKEIMELEKIATKKKKEKECEERRRKMLQKRDTLERNKLLKAIKDRGIFLNEGEEEFDEEVLVKTLSNIDISPLSKGVRFDGDRLVWSVLLLYPEYETTDIIESFHEDHTFEYELSEIFNNHADWDVEHKYKMNTISLYYENIQKKIKSINLTTPLGSMLSKKDFRIENGVPTFLVLAKNSEAEKNVLKRYK